MRLLVLDHFFGQDIEALRAAAAPGVELRVIDYELLRDEAMRIFPPDVAGTLEAPVRPEYEPHRRAFARRLGALLEEQFSRDPFDAFVAPSDTFFYVRDAPAACHALGVPFLVVQKETTISPLIMEWADEVGAYAPPVADHMTVCGERLLQFWLRAGGDRARITITGQPRFDFYARPEEWPGALPYGDEGPLALFFAYHIDHHHPTEGQGVPVWQGLHEQTEKALWELARRGWRVLVKPHPQQQLRAERRRLGGQVGDLMGRRVFLVDPRDDARRLIAGADVVIGFQTTAMLEAMLAGRPVVYTGWDREAVRLGSELIPFAEWSDVVHVVTRGAELPETVERALGRTYDAVQAARARAIVEEHLGVVDGRASQRVLAAIGARVEDFRGARTPGCEAHRHAVSRRRAPLALRRRARRGWRRMRRSAGAALGR
jgi:hypothetical protein